MLTGIVFDIDKDTAIIMKHCGKFIEVKACGQWKKGDIVTIEDKKMIPRAFYLAASIVLLIFLGMLSFRIYFQETTLISMDVNPSIEIGLNRFDRVIYLNDMNNDGAELLHSLNIKNKNYTEALKIIAESENLKEYINENSYFAFALQTDDKEKEALISKQVEEAFQNIIVSDSSEYIDIFVVDEEIVNKAHSCHMTPGKYMKFQQLKEVDQDVEIEDYTNMGVGEIQRCIDSHHKGSNNTTSNDKCNHQIQNQNTHSGCCGNGMMNVDENNTDGNDYHHD